MEFERNNSYLVEQIQKSMEVKLWTKDQRMIFSKDYKIRSHFALEAHFNQAKFHLTILQLWSANVHIETMKWIPKQLTIYNIN